MDEVDRCLDGDRTLRKPQPAPVQCSAFFSEIFMTRLPSGSRPTLVLRPLKPMDPQIPSEIGQGTTKNVVHGSGLPRRADISFLPPLTHPEQSRKLPKVKALFRVSDTSGPDPQIGCKRPKEILTL